MPIDIHRDHVQLDAAPCAALVALPKGFARAAETNTDCLREVGYG